MCTNCSTIARGLDAGCAPGAGDWFIEHAIGRRGVPVAYTVGLTGVDQPELIIRELPFGVAHRILHVLVEQSTHPPVRLLPGPAGVVDGRHIVLRRYAYSIELTEAVLRYDGIIGVLQAIPEPQPLHAVPGTAAELHVPRGSWWTIPAGGARRGA